ncbi:MAG: tRNA (5-methylaminomethyl-2-thiouridine)(34)-methyltransferase MnmD [Chlorobi bacterium]|nr:tRNA (5-methylaminomethyl-2-thiouridine)(34)-methyltransferase MnmD [Chlorobiota bacterium]
MNKIILTGDNSHTLYNQQFGEHYHSTNGAVQESVHVFINAGLKTIQKKEISILEIGFGTGLNAFLTLLESKKTKQKIKYTTLELHPVKQEEINKLNYVDILGNKEEFMKLHSVEWDKWQIINSIFKLKKLEVNLKYFTPNDNYDLVYFDAFSAKAQPDLWGYAIFRAIVNAMNTNAVLTTYSAKGIVRRTLIECGLKVERIPGPPGKREMIRAIKHS